VRSLFGSLLFASLIAVTAAQQPPAPAGNAKPNSAPQVAMQDGGVDQVLQSIYIPALEDAPFDAIVHTEWIRPLTDGGTFTLVNQRQIARDSAGRIYEERWVLVPKGGSIESRMSVIQIGDPVAHTLYNCFLLIEPHRCILQDFREPAIASYRTPTMRSGPVMNGEGTDIHEDLGMQNFSGVETVGTRDTTTINPGFFGNDRPYTKTREFWFAPSLGIDLRSEVTDPSFGKQIFTVTDVNSSEPDAKLFELPAGFEVVDRRKHPAQTGQTE